MRSRWFGGDRRPGEVDWARHVRQDTERADQVLYAIMAINVVVWIVWQYTIRGPYEGLMAANFLVGLEAMQSGRVWTLLTAELSHISLDHLLFNMIGLFVFGRAVGRAVGSLQFLHLYVVGGIVASLGHVAYNAVSGDMVPALGASGAVMALAAVYGALFPDRTLLIGFVLPMPAWLAVLLFILLDVFGLISGGGGIAHAAHLGGAAYGLAFWYLRLRRPPPGKRFKPGTFGTRL